MLNWLFDFVLFCLFEYRWTRRAMFAIFLIIVVASGGLENRMTAIVGILFIAGICELVELLSRSWGKR